MEAIKITDETIPLIRSRMQDINKDWDQIDLKNLLDQGVYYFLHKKLKHGHKLSILSRETMYKRYQFSGLIEIQFVPVKAR